MTAINGNEPMLQGSKDAVFNDKLKQAKRDLLIKVIRQGADSALNNDTLVDLDEKYLDSDQRFNQWFWAELEEMWLFDI
jgi:hypothetical protein